MYWQHWAASISVGGTWVGRSSDQGEQDNQPGHLTCCLSYAHKKVCCPSIALPGWISQSLSMPRTSSRVWLFTLLDVLKPESERKEMVCSRFHVIKSFHQANVFKSDERLQFTSSPPTILAAALLSSDYSLCHFRVETPPHVFVFFILSPARPMWVWNKVKP